MTAAIMSDRFSMGRWRSAPRQHSTIGPRRVWKRNVDSLPRPHASHRRSTVVDELTRPILFRARQT
jgi:hypothetical protein